MSVLQRLRALAAANRCVAEIYMLPRYDYQLSIKNRVLTFSLIPPVSYARYLADPQDVDVGFTRRRKGNFLDRYWSIKLVKSPATTAALRVRRLKKENDPERNASLTRSH